MTNGPSTPRWEPDPSGEAYTLSSGAFRCRVWFTSLNTWAAAHMYHGTSSASYSFTTVEDAQAWCEQQVAKADRRM